MQCDMLCCYDVALYCKMITDVRCLHCKIINMLVHNSDSHVRREEISLHCEGSIGLFGRQHLFLAVSSKCFRAECVAASKSLRLSNMHMRCVTPLEGSAVISSIPEQLKDERLRHFAYLHLCPSLASCINQYVLNYLLISTTGDQQTNETLDVSVWKSSTQQTELVQLQLH